MSNTSAASPINETEQQGDERRRERSRAFDIAMRVFSNRDGDIEETLKKYDDPFRTMIADEYQNLEDDARADDAFEMYAGHE